MRIAYLGDENSHTYAAAKLLTSGADTFFGYQTGMLCVQALEDGKVDFCVLPQENSVEGTVSETADILIEKTVYIIREICLPIKQCLVGYNGAEFSGIKTVYSHYQALAQCRKYLSAHFPDANIIAVKSTSDALKRITGKDIVAVARQSSSSNTVILKDNINDYSSNETKFIMLGRKPEFNGNKCSILFDSLDEPGALLGVLNLIAGDKINMSKIESRPQKTKLGRYLFFVDFEFLGGKDELTAFLAKLQSRTSLLKFLGKYNAENLRSF